ncbi:hypothetical protein Taro_020377 [Colocasia esculenta]|uniref:Uncharacterized protein n=1 Tax=Colocasia esculenta TaxID=4460 RepID=A0A843V260_COLES|nr:hypothetical protein [Colocasia esculenta]
MRAALNSLLQAMASHMVTLVGNRFMCCMILRSAQARSCSNGWTMSAKGFIGSPNWLVRLAPGCSFGSSSSKGVRRPSSRARLSSWPPLDGAGRSAGLVTFWQGSSLMISSCSSSSSSDGSKTKELTRTSTSGMGWGSSPRKMMVLLRSGKLGFSPSDGVSFFPRLRPFPLPRLRRRYVATGGVSAGDCKLAGGGIDTILHEKSFSISSSFSMVISSSL